MRFESKLGLEGRKMTRRKLEKLIFERFGVLADYPFEDDLVTGVFRHADNGKWFAIAMNVCGNKIGLLTDDRIDIVNLKCSPEVIESLVGVEDGVYRAYHMNKMHWLTISLDGRADDGLISWLLDASYELTRKMDVKSKQQKKKPQ